MALCSLVLWASDQGIVYAFKGVDCSLVEVAFFTG